MICLDQPLAKWGLEGPTTAAGRGNENWRGGVEKKALDISLPSLRCSDHGRARSVLVRLLSPFFRFVLYRLPLRLVKTRAPLFIGV